MYSRSSLPSLLLLIPEGKLGFTFILTDFYLIKQADGLQKSHGLEPRFQDGGKENVKNLMENTTAKSQNPGLRKQAKSLKHNY